MNKEDMAALLDGRQIGSEITKEEVNWAKDDGLVIVYIYQDKNITFYGHYNGSVRRWKEESTFIVDGTVVDGRGSIQKGVYACNNTMNKEFVIIPMWDKNGRFWYYETNIPRANFNIMDGNRKHGQGFVFHRSDTVIVRDRERNKDVRNISKTTVLKWIKTKDEVPTYKSRVLIQRKNGLGIIDSCLYTWRYTQYDSDGEETEPRFVQIPYRQSAPTYDAGSVEYWAYLPGYCTEITPVKYFLAMPSLIADHYFDRVVRTLGEYGHQLTHDWYNAAKGASVQGNTKDALTADIHGIYEADVVIVFGPGGNNTCVEIGVALAFNKRVLLVDITPYWSKSNKMRKWPEYAVHSLCTRITPTDGNVESIAQDININLHGRLYEAVRAVHD